MTRWGTVRKVLLATSALVPLGLAAASANPLGPNVVGGAATVTGTGTANVTVNQSSDRAIINWNSFNLGAGDTTRFVQPSATSIALNRVTGGLGPSQLYGTLTANGRVFVVNPDGIMVGRGAVIDTAGFLASTNDITNANFMAGRYHFNIPGRPDASIVNRGIINAHSHGFAALVAPGVRNSGTITATFGTVALASGNSFSLDFYGDQLITLAVGDSIGAQVRDVATGQPLNALVKNEGALRAKGGRVELTAAAARTVVDSVINNRGVVEARSIGTRNGRIVLSAATSATKPAGAPAQTVKVSGRLSTAGARTKGGTIQVTGETIKIRAASFDASGATGGGTVLIGGDVAGGLGHAAVAASIPQARLEAGPVPTATTVRVDAATRIDASATSVGDGGKVIVWADGATRFAGTILARGGAFGGDGGFAEVSGQQTLYFSGLANLGAPYGRSGTLLLDPLDYTVGTVDGPNSISNTTLQNNLASNDVLITNNPGAGHGDIFVTHSVTWSADTTLTLNAFRNIQVGGNATIANTGAGNLVMHADIAATGTGTVVLDAGTTPNRVDWSGSTGTVRFFYNPASYASPTNFRTPATGGRVALNPSETEQFRAYMLINSLTDLGGLALNPGGNYALNGDLDGFGATIPALTFNFSGEFDGLNHTISNVVINGPAALAVNSGTIRNLTIENLTINATANSQFVGWVGINASGGHIFNVHTGGTVSGGVFHGITAGGLVGENLGDIGMSSSSANVTVGNGIAAMTLNIAGGLVGSNLGGIEKSNASGAVIAGSFASAGGLVGQNGPNVGLAQINLSSATGNVSSSGVGVSLGGLVGFNAPGALIMDSHATGNVTANGNLSPANCSGTLLCSLIHAGGLIGTNQGTVASTQTPATTFATGNVFVGAGGLGGGFVGFNSGIIANTFANGAVTGNAGFASDDSFNRSTVLGGFAGLNQGLIGQSSAAGNVGALGVDNLIAGGFVGDNGGSIIVSSATGNVRVGNFSHAGGFLGAGDSDGCFGCSIPGDGAAFAGLNAVTSSTASGNVIAGSSSIAGGFAASGSTILHSTASGAVTAGANSILGGFVGVHDIGGAIRRSTATGSVTATGASAWLGGFVGMNAGIILNSAASGAVLGTSDSIIGGFAGVNIGWIDPSAALGSVTGSGANNLVGGFVGVNFGSIDDSMSEGPVTGVGANNAVGRFAGANAVFTNLPANLLVFSSFPTGTISNSTGTGLASGGPGSSVGGQIGVSSPSSLPDAPSIVATCTAVPCEFIRQGTLPDTPVTPEPPVIPHPPHIPPLANLLPDSVRALPIAALAPDRTVRVETPGALIQLRQPAAITATRTPGSAPGSRPGSAAPQPGTAARMATVPGTPPRSLAPPRELRPVAGIDGETRSNVPPVGETRFDPRNVILQFGLNTTAAELQSVAQRLGMTVTSCQTMTSLGRTACQFQVGGGRAVRDVIRALEANRIVAVAQPDYKYTLVQAPAAVAPFTASRGDPAQYTMGKLLLDQAHRIASGSNVLIAVVDSDVDREHKELAGTVAERFDATGTEARAHSHGTAMVGAIVSRDRLLGVAPGARILAVRAFSETQTTAESTTFTILKGIEWAVSQNARVINMSFAGPYDPSLERALKDAAAKGVILIGASGNAGPKSAPLWPGADPNVIAVTATDSNDKLFRQANRGPYVAVAAPGVEILAPAPEAGYQMSTGTSIATAHVTGVVALMLERDPTLTPRDVREILESTAADLGPKGRDTQFGWGLVNPQRALAMVEERKRKAGSAATPPASPAKR